MKEKGQIVIVLAGVLLLIGVFIVGLLAGRKSSPVRDVFLDLEKIIVLEDKNLKDGDTHTSRVVVDNCRSSVPSTIEETREFVYQQLFSVDIRGEFGSGFKDAVYVKLEKTFGIESGKVEKVSRKFQFNSPPEAISMHVITWTEKLRTGYIEYQNNKYTYSFPDDIQVSSTSFQEICP